MAKIINADAVLNIEHDENASPADSKQAAIDGIKEVQGIPTVDKSRTQSSPVDLTELPDQGDLAGVDMIDEEGHSW